MNTASREDVFRLHAQICKALADPSRVLILVELRRGPKTVGEIAEAIGASQPMTSRPLGVLRDKGLLQATRHGTFVRYSLTDRRILAAIDLLLDVLAAQLTRQGARGNTARRLRSIARSA